MAGGLANFFRRMVKPGSSQPSEAGRPGAPGQLAEPVVHNGYEIRPEPHRQESMWLVAGTISRDTGSGVRTHYFLRADSHSDRDHVVELSIIKAKQMIDIEGDRIFDKPSDRR